MNLYEETKPDYVLSHECPTEAVLFMLQGLIGQYFEAKRDCVQSRTAQALQLMYEIHQPKEWCFGHYHVDKTFHLKPDSRTKFTCVAELSQYVLEL